MFESAKDSITGGQNWHPSSQQRISVFPKRSFVFQRAKEKITAVSCNGSDFPQPSVERSGQLVSKQRALSARDDAANLYKNGMEIKTSEGIMDLGN